MGMFGVSDGDRGLRTGGVLEEATTGTETGPGAPSFPTMKGLSSSTGFSAA